MANGVSNLMEEEHHMVYNDLLKVDPDKQFVRNRMPSKPHARCQTLDKEQKAQIRALLREFAWDGYQAGKVYHDRRTNVNAYSCLYASEPDYLVEKAIEAEKIFPVKVYLIPHVQWIGYRPTSYYKFRVTYLG